jgi:hypothetical protein
MCEQCVEIDQAVERYRRIRATINDQVTIDKAQELIATGIKEARASP